MPCTFCYTSERLARGAETPPIDRSIQQIEDSSNPLFNFPATFLQNYQSITPQDLALAQPYISLCSLNQDGTVLQNFNLSFFSKGINFDALSSGQRFADRPDLSLVDVRIMTDLSQGTMYFRNVVVSMKMHNPSQRTSAVLASVLYVGSAFQLTYGWSSPNNGNQFLSQKETLYFTLRNYTIDFNVQGEAELTIEGLALSDATAVLVGDQGNIAQADDKVNTQQANGIAATQQKREAIANHAIQSAAPGTNSTALTQQQAKDYQPRDLQATIAITQQFNDCMAQLDRLKLTDPALFPNITKKLANRLVQGEYVTLSDLIKTLCGPTLDAIHGPYIPSNTQFRFVYGAFNSSVSGFSNRSLADFPINWRSFKKDLNKFLNNGGKVPSMRAVINMLIGQYLNNQMYWTNNLLPPNSENAKIPICRFNVVTHKVGDRNVVQMCLLDERKDVPNTQQQVRALGQDLATEAQLDQAISRGNIPVIRLGHANSFVREMHLQHIADATMQTIFLNRSLSNTSFSARVPVTDDKKIKSQKTTPFILPLQGDLEVIGHVEWQPMRFFYLKSGIYLIDAVYQINRVEHTLDATGFHTTVGFTYH